MKKRLLSLALAAAMILSLLPTAAFAAEGYTPDETVLDGPVVEVTSEDKNEPGEILDEGEREPEETPDEGETQEPGETSDPEETQEPAETLDPKETQEPEETPDEGETQEPEETSEPEETQEPEETSDPEETQEPEETPDENLPSEDMPSEMEELLEDEVALLSLNASDLLANEAQMAATPLGNLCRPLSGEGVTVTATASGEEASSVRASNAIDGDCTSKSSRWGSAVGNGPHWIQVDLGTVRAVSVVRIFWERRNVLAYTLQGSADGQTWYDLYSCTSEITTVNETLTFDPVAVRYLKVYISSHKDTGLLGDGTESTRWNTVSLFEIEAYRNEASMPVDTQSVANAVELVIRNGKVVADTTAADELAGDWEFDISFAANLEQVVGPDGTIYTPLVNTNVELDVTVERLFDGVKAFSSADSPFVMTIPGEHLTNMGNAKPKVIPEIMEWYSSSAQKGQSYTLTGSSRIVAPAALTDVANEVKADIKDLFGFDLSVVSSGAEAGDIELVLDASKANEGFDDETYLMEVTDKVTITGAHATGVYWGTRTALQALKLSGGKNTIPQGTARDYPEFRLRGFVMDVGRKPVSMDMLYNIVKNMAWYKLNDFHVHLNDNLIQIENYGYTNNNCTQEQYNEGNRAYAGFRLESSLQEEQGANPLASRDFHYTKAEFSQFITDSEKLGVTIVPEIDVPAHAKAITDAWPSLREPKNFNIHALNDHFNLSGKFDECLAKTEEIFNDYIDDGTFHSGIVHFGADEYYPNSTLYRKFHKAMIAYLKTKNVTIRTWGSLTRMSSSAPDVQYSKEETKGVQMNIWNTGWANPTAMYNLGFDLINVTDGPSYMVPNGGGGRGGYGDYLNLNSIYGWEPNVIGGTVFPASSSQILGSAYAMWDDGLLDMQATGLDEVDLFHRFYDSLPVIAVRQWGEGDKLDRTLDELQSDAAITGLAPQSNPYFKVEPGTDGKLFEYTFDTDGSDSSVNGRDLTLHGAEVTGGALAIKGGSSYASTGMDRLGWGSSLTFTINVTKAPSNPYGEVIFESDRVAEDSTFPYNEYAIKALPVEGDSGKWKLGFARELYDYEFATEFTVGTEVQVTITSAQHKTSMSANGGGAVNAVGKLKPKANSNTQFMGKEGITHSSFELPVARIGSKTNAFTGTIDNISTTAPQVEKPVIPDEGTELVNLALKRPVTVSDTGATNGGVTGTAEKAVDGVVEGNETVAWVGGDMTTNRDEHGNQNNPQWLIVDLGEEVANMALKAERITVSYGQRSFATKYDIQTSDSANGEWTSLLTDTVSRGHIWGWLQPSTYGSNGDSITSTSNIGSTGTKLKENPVLKRYVRLYVTEVNAANGNNTNIGGNNGQCKSVAVTEFQIMARLPITESAENIKAYQISEDEVRLSWNEGGYYQVYAKAPGGQWACISGDEVVNGSVFIHDGYVDGVTYRVLSPASDVNSALGAVTPVDIRTYDTDPTHYGWVDCGNAQRVTLGEGGWSTWADGNAYGGGVHYAPNNNANENTTAEFVFVGNGVQVIGTQFPDGGAFSVFIDGKATGEKANGKAPGSSNVANATIYSKTGLTNGFHIIKLVADRGARVEVDAFRVLIPATSITLSANGLADGKLTIATGGSAVNVTATVAPANGSGVFEWTSSDEGAATVATTEPSPGPQGKMVATITPVSGGTTTIVVKDKSDPTIKAEVAVTVNQSVTNVTLPDNQHSVTLYLDPAVSQNSTATLTPTVMPATATNKAVTWRSSNKAVATVEEGIVTAVGKGEATITVTTVDGGKTADCVVTVKSNPTAIAVKDGQKAVTEAAPAVIYNNKDITGLPNTVRNRVTLTAALTPADATETDLTWERADVSTGLITIEPMGNDPTRCAVTAVGINERDVGEKTIVVTSVSNPTVKTTFKVRVLRHLVHDVTLSVHAGAEAKPGAVLEVNINQLNLDDAGVDGLTYQWYRGADAIGGATEKTYTLTDEDIGKAISAKVTAKATETYFYEGERTSGTVMVGKNAAPAAPVLSATEVNGGVKGTITIANAGADAVYQISRDNGQTWTDATVINGVIENLEEGDYQVRLKETDTHEAGLPAAITVKNAAKTYYAVSYTVSPADAGTVVLDKTSAEANDSVTATVKTNPGFTLKGVTVGGVEINGTEGQDGAKLYTVETVTADVEFVVSFEAVKLTITHNLSNGVSCDKAVGGADAHSHEVAYGAQEAITLVAAEGYRLPDRQHITVKKTQSGDAFLGYEYSPETGVITITGGVTEDLTIEAAGVVATYQIAHALTHVKCSLTEHIVEHKAALTIGVTADEGYILPETITVSMVGTELTAADYTYTKAADNKTGELTFAAGKITGALEIRIDGERIMIPLVSVSIEGTAKVGQRLSARVNPAEAANYVNYQWIRVDADGGEETAEDIAGATGMSRVITEASLGKRIKVKIVPAQDSQYTGTVTSQATAVVIAADAPSIPVELVSLDRSAVTLVPGGSTQLVATVRPSNATNQTVAWSSDNEAVATVDSAGVVTGVAKGTAAITVTTADGNKTAVCQVTVKETGETRTFQVTFEVQGGSAVEAQTVVEGGKAIRPADPTRNGYTFGGWYTDAGCTAAYDFETAVTADLTLYAKWTENSSSSSGSSGSSSGSDKKPTGVTNEDGSVTTTVKDGATGTVTTTTKWPSGKVEVVETKKDGSVTKTTTEADGKKVEKKVTAEKDVTITVTDPQGETVAKVKLPAVVPAPEKRFEDVPQDHWADKAIHTVAGLGLVEGIGENRYDMQTPMTRGSLATVLCRLSNGKAVKDVSFTDVEKDEWYTEGISWAAKNGVVTGVSANTFKPKDVITREQLAVMLCRYAKVLGMDVESSAKALESFRDSDKTGAWAVDGVAWCVEKGILRGKGENNLDPTADVSRAEVAVMLERFVALMR